MLPEHRHGLGAAIASPLVDQYRWCWPWVTGVLWVGQEALRDREPFGGFPWGRLAFSQAAGTREKRWKQTVSVTAQLSKAAAQAFICFGVTRDGSSTSAARSRAS